MHISPSTKIYKKNIILIMVVASVVSAIACDRTQTKKQDTDFEKRETQSEQKFDAEITHAERHTEFMRDASRLPPRPAGLSMDSAVVENPYDVVSYDLHGHYNWDSQRLEADLAITLKPLTANLEHIDLDSAVASIKTVKTAAGKYLPFTVDESTHKLIIDLPLEERVPQLAALTLTISYEAVPGMNFRAIDARKGDPNQSHVVYTTSEPLGAADWMPCHNAPSDRAEFSTDFTMPVDENLIANGDLLDNSIDGGERHVHYKTRYTLPPYLMAFAIGQFDVATRQHGGLPVSLWSRRGIPVDSSGVLTELIRQIAAYEALLIPFPFEKYAVVMLPDFPAGGIEHAGITFQAEDRSTESSLPSDMGLMAHELGHQWFGDYMTIAGWDDLWIKEGMATLLAEEAMRPLEDRNASGRLFGGSFNIAAGEAIRDESLAPDAKYTSGPYERSAWFFTQIRSVVGERAFWQTMRQTLKNHAFGSVSSEQMIESFRGVLPEDIYNKSKLAIDSKAIPVISYVPSAETNPSSVIITLSESEPNLLAPVEIRWQTPEGSAQTEFLEAGKPVNLSPRENQVLVIDPRDIQPDWTSFSNSKDYSNIVLPLMTPQTPTSLEAFLLGSASTQSRVLSSASSMASLVPSNFLDIYSRLNSETAKFQVLQLACHIAAVGPSEVQLVWKPVLNEALRSLPTRGFRTRSQGFAECRSVTGDEEINQFWKILATNPQSNGFNETQLQTLALFASDANQALASWLPVALDGRWVRTREIATYQLLKYAKNMGGFIRPGSTEIPAWREGNTKIIRNSEVYEVLNPALQLAVELRSPITADNNGTIGAISEVLLKSHRTARAHLRGVCTIRTLLEGNAELWDAFVRSAQSSLTILEPSARQALYQPDISCRDFI